MSKTKAKNLQNLTAADSHVTSTAQNECKFSACATSFGGNFLSLLLLMLKLKSWRTIFLVAPLALAGSAHPLLSLLSGVGGVSQKKAPHDLQFYGASDLAASRHRVLVERAAFPAEIGALANIVTQRGGSTGWLKDCSSENECKAEYVSETDASVIAYISYPRPPSQVRAHLDCMHSTGSSLRCALLHQLLTQSICRNCSAFADVKFFIMEAKALDESAMNQKQDTETGSNTSYANLSLPDSICNRILKAGRIFSTMGMHTTFSLGLTALGVSFYLLVSTLHCIRSWKSNGFLQHLVRSGLSSGIYWLVMMTATLVFLCLMVLLVSYLDCLLSTGSGLRLPVHFPVSCRFWRPRSAQLKDGKSNTQGGTAETAAHIEPVTGFSPSIVVDKISKSYGYSKCFGTDVMVLHELSCKIYRNHITALIGHNGAGKSTLIKILTGEETPNSGTARIDGFNATDSLDRLSLRGRISICPQFDSLCGNLSVMESVRTTLSCMGLCSDTELGRARAMLQRLGLSGKEDVKSTDLSGGQKRKEVRS